VTDPALPFALGALALDNVTFEGHNNAYLLGHDADGPTTLVDTGDPHPDTRDGLAVGLADHGVAFADIDRVLLTHWHGDHTGLAAEIQATGGATVACHPADAPLIADEDGAREANRDRIDRLLAAWGTPAEKRAEALSVVETGTDVPAPSVTTFDDGDRFDCGSVTLEAVHLPGHTEGLTGFAFDGRDGEELFSGDALLPYYTPNVGGADTRVESPLADYLGTLAGIHDRGFTRAWPGHRGPIVDPPGRAADIVAHHRDRARRVLDVLRDGPADPWTVSASLFGSLSAIHVLHGPGEAYAHLDHLAAAGVLERDGDQYRAIDPDAPLDDLFPALAADATPE